MFMCWLNSFGDYFCRTTSKCMSFRHLYISIHRISSKKKRHVTFLLLAEYVDNRTQPIYSCSSLKDVCKEIQKKNVLKWKLWKKNRIQISEAIDADSFRKMAPVLQSYLMSRFSRICQYTSSSLSTVKNVVHCLLYILLDWWWVHIRLEHTFS